MEWISQNRAQQTAGRIILEPAGFLNVAVYRAVVVWVLFAAAR